MSPRHPVLTVSAAARALGLSRATVRTHVAKGMPLSSLAAAKRWRDENLDPARVARGLQHGQGTAPGRSALVLARTRRMAADARLAELKALVAQGVLVDARHLRSILARRLIALREALANLPGRVASPIAAESCAERVGEILRSEVLAALAVGEDLFEP